MVTIATRVQRPSVLLVKAERYCDESFEDMLGREGFEFFLATSGEAALADYAARQPDLVLLDVWLPGMDGIETACRLRDRYGDGCAPILFMKGGAASVHDATGFPAGVVDFLPEPFVSREAMVHIRAHVEGWRTALRQRAIIAELSATMEEKAKLLSVCSHDLRSPLASVCGLTEFLLDPATGFLNSRQTELADAIHEATQSLLKLVNQLFDVSVLETGHLKLEPAPGFLRDSVQRAVFLSAVAAARKAIRIVLQPATSAEPMLMMDEVRIREVVDNLLGNAVKYSPRGSFISVAIESLPADIESGPCVRFSVRDQGPGVPAAERDLLFRDFSRLSACPTGGEKSTGLGLAICRKIVDLHGGSIGAVNHPEGGCVFSFILPVFPCKSPVPL
jgi:signal transduction histidine kinase